MCIFFLAHPNIKLFVSHGGLIGTQEAIFNGVPIIGVPIYADQYNNLLQAQYLGCGKILEYHDINEKNFGKILNEVLGNQSYAEKAKALSVRFKDRPLSALDTAMFWIEYVIRNNGADYIKNPALELSWVASSMLDVYVFVLMIILTIIYVVLKLILISISYLKKGEPEKKLKKN